MKKIEEISLLYEISEALNEHLELKRSLYKVLETLSNTMGMVRGTISIVNPLSNEISIEVAHGISSSTMESVTYKVGEGITGRVIESGKPIVIPKISEEPLFLNRTASRKGKQDQDLSFICNPIKKGNQVIGAISVDKPLDTSYSLEVAQQLMAVISTMIARHVINLETIRLGGTAAPGRKRPASERTGKQIQNHRYHRKQQ